MLEYVLSHYFRALSILVRTHPITKYKTLFVNEYFTSEIVGLNKEEYVSTATTLLVSSVALTNWQTMIRSQALLNYLWNVFAKGADIQIRYKWEPHTVTIWDNRYASVKGVSLLRRMVVHPAPQHVMDKRSHTKKGKYVNRAVQHQAVWDYYPEIRKGRRVTTVGEVPLRDHNATTQSDALKDVTKTPPLWTRTLKL